MKPYSAFFLSAFTILLVSCDKEPEVVVRTTDDRTIPLDKGDVAAVDKNTGTAVVKDEALIWPAVEETVRSQIKALNKEDLDGYMSYMHPDNPTYASTRQQLEDIAEKYDLRYTLEKLERVSVTEDEVKASFVQLTEKVSGPAFSNNRISGVHTLRRDNGKWKIFATTTNSMAAVDPQP
ncbi:MAG TPA: nuclear transport factor 2 family protein [Verrucomicrobiales bacterium]|nr:nuclear transport factor 2 family protein [Verrucomicrobiales bacterium]